MIFHKYWKCVAKKNIISRVILLLFQTWFKIEINYSAQKTDTILFIRDGLHFKIVSMFVHFCIIFIQIAEKILEDFFLESDM